MRGGQIGYNWQFRRAVVGLETDFNYLGLNQSTSLFAVARGAVPITFHDSVHWLGTVRDRADRTAALRVISPSVR